MARNGGYVSIDIEADGPVPGLNSMLSLGAAAFNGEGHQLQTFSMNLEQLPEAKEDRDTMEWWAKRPEDWRIARDQPWPPSVVMPAFRDWLFALRPGYFICVAKPAGFDFAYISYYLHRFAGVNPFGFFCLDIASFWQGMGKAKVKFDKTGLRPHVALDDAIEQGRLFAALLKERERRDNVTTVPSNPIR